MLRVPLAIVLGIAALFSAPGRSQDTVGRSTVGSNELFAMAEAAQRSGHSELAESYYRALTHDPVLQIRNEARFRLAMILARQSKLAASATLLRQILDEQPQAQRVRLELARLQDLMGDDAAARRLLREAQAGGLPSDVIRFVDRYSAALRARKPFGASVDISVAPDSNINRATRRDALDTVFGDFALNDTAKETSGVGLAVRGQFYGRLRLSAHAALLARVSGAGDFYRAASFNEVAFGVSAGPEFSVGQDRLAIEGGFQKQMFGGRVASSSITVAASLLHPLDRQSQLRLNGSVGARTDGFNRLQDGKTYAATIGYERALSATFGIGGSAAFDRQSLRDPGYSTTDVQAGIFAYRELGATTFVASAAFGRLVADERLFLYPERRRDRFARISLGATFRQMAVSGFAPFARLTLERNASNIAIFDYRRTRAEMGVTHAF
jgi:hypothetical protein